MIQHDIVIVGGGPAGMAAAVAAYDACEGYWTNDMQWHEGTNFDFSGWMIEDLFSEIKEK